jgi:hypothetical protein
VNQIVISSAAAAWLTEPCPTCAPGESCDWGYCDDESVGFRLDERDGEKRYLPVCHVHYDQWNSCQRRPNCPDCNGTGRKNRWLAVEGVLDHDDHPPPACGDPGCELIPPPEWSAAVSQTVELVTVCQFSPPHGGPDRKCHISGTVPVLTCRAERKPLPIFGPHMQRSEVRDFVSLRKGGPWLNQRDRAPVPIALQPGAQAGWFAVELA